MKRNFLTNESCFVVWVWIIFVTSINLSESGDWSRANLTLSLHCTIRSLLMSPDLYGLIYFPALSFYFLLISQPSCHLPSPNPETRSHKIFMIITAESVITSAGVRWMMRAAVTVISRMLTSCICCDAVRKRRGSGPGMVLMASCQERDPLTCSEGIKDITSRVIKWFQSSLGS